MSERAVHQFERFLRSFFGLTQIGEITRQLLDLGRPIPGAGETWQPLVLEMNEELRQAALDRFEMIEPGIRGVQFLNQLGDAALEMAKRGLIAAAQLHALDLVRQAFKNSFELDGHALPALVTRGERVGEHGNSFFQRIENIIAA